MKINTVGLWAMRIVLVVGAVVCGCLDKSDAVVACFIALILSFVLLDDD